MPTLDIDLNWPDHPKTKRLIRSAGKEAPFSLVTLWCYAAKFHPIDGDLSKYTPEDIEGISGWTGEPGVFYSALLSSRYLDDNMMLHDWKDHEGHLAAYQEKARIMNEARSLRRQARYRDESLQVTSKTSPLLSPPHPVQSSPYSRAREGNNGHPPPEIGKLPVYKQSVDEPMTPEQIEKSRLAKEALRERGLLK